MSYENGKTALKYVSDEIDGSIRDIDACLKTGFSGCPPEGVAFHLAIGRAVKAGAMWDGINVRHAMEKEAEHKRRTIEEIDVLKKATEAAEHHEDNGIKIDVRKGIFNFEGQGINMAVKITAIVCVVVLGWKMLDNQQSMRDNQIKISAELKKVAETVSEIY